MTANVHVSTTYLKGKEMAMRLKYPEIVREGDLFTITLPNDTTISTSTEDAAQQIRGILLLLDDHGGLNTSMRRDWAYSDMDNLLYYFNRLVGKDDNAV